MVLVMMVMMVMMASREEHPESSRGCEAVCSRCCSSARSGWMMMMMMMMPCSRLMLLLQLLLLLLLVMLIQCLTTIGFRSIHVPEEVVIILPCLGMRCPERVPELRHTVVHERHRIIRTRIAGITGFQSPERELTTSSPAASRREEGRTGSSSWGSRELLRRGLMMVRMMMLLTRMTEESSGMGWISGMPGSVMGTGEAMDSGRGWMLLLLTSLSTLTAAPVHHGFVTVR